MRGRLVLGLFLLFALLGPGGVEAQDDGVSYPEDHRPARPHRSLEVGAGAAYLASFPGAMSDGGPLLQGAFTFLRREGRYLEFTLDAAVALAVGVEAPGLHLTLGPRAGAALNLGWLGFEMKMGLATLAQVAARSAGGFALWGQGGYVLRFGEEGRQRVKLLLTFRAGAFLAEDPGNDMGMSAMSMGLLMAYEWPLSSASK